MTLFEMEACELLETLKALSTTTECASINVKV
jgi:hypothetical protein